MPDKNDIRPLAERCRPKTLEDFIGQSHLLEKGKIVRTILDRRKCFSIVLWGEPGCGKTTLAKLIGEYCEMDSYFLSAVSSGVTEVRKVIEKGRVNRLHNIQTLLFLDEIHRFNKAQQDAVLGAVESGDIVLIGATTENPSFEVIAPLLSRMRVLKMYPLSEEDLLKILDNALRKDSALAELEPEIEDPVKAAIVQYAAGDARRMLNLLEQCVALSENGKIGMELLEEAMRNTAVYYDRAGDRHYDTISAFIKSLRGSDPNAAVYYLARMLLAGEEPEFIARRMVIFASEDIGNAYPQALSVAISTFLAVKNIGLPEAEINLAHCTTFLASCPKSNASYLALREAQKMAKDFSIQIPLHLRNAPTSLMKQMGYGKDYKYPHDHKGHFVNEDYLPDELKNKVFYHPSEEGNEKAVLDRLKRLWPEKYNNSKD